MTTARRETRGPAVWAFILIAFGVIWLLAEANVFSSANLAVLFRLWPVVLIAFGLELLIGRGSRSLSLLIGFGTVVLLLVLMVVGPALGLAPAVEIHEQQYSEPLGDTASAQINLDLSVGRTTIQPLTDSNDLISADLRYVGEVDFRVDGTTDKYVSLSNRDNTVQVFDFLGFSLFNGADDDQLRWNIGLTPNIPLDLRLNGGVGESSVDLGALQLTSLDYNNGVGDTRITLPAPGSYSVRLNGGVGNTWSNFASGATVTVNITGGVGNITLDVPDNAPVRLNAQGGLGNINVPSSFNQISGDRNGVSRSGEWETANYAAADGSRIQIEFNGGVGQLVVQ
ncbi:MAG: hypothetical protein IT319_19360 [Anaerolineae bacterium]|nr:hypothetical protein [Anaerolineae bacterium]